MREIDQRHQSDSVRTRRPLNMVAGKLQGDFIHAKRRFILSPAIW